LSSIAGVFNKEKSLKLPVAIAYCFNSLGCRLWLVLYILSTNISFNDY